MEFQDKTLVCKECGKDFTFTASEQQFYADKGFQNEPSRCPDDRIKHREERRNRPKTEVQCANCGQTTTVPFEPKGDRPVYCLECFKIQKETGKLPDPSEVNPGGTPPVAPEATEAPEATDEEADPKDADEAAPKDADEAAPAGE